MAERQVVGLRYCGGCNPRYDRVAAVERLKARLPAVELRPAAPGQKLALVVCGCSARCADVSDLDCGLVWLCAEAQLEEAAGQLCRINILQEGALSCPGRNIMPPTP